MYKSPATCVITMCSTELIGVRFHIQHEPPSVRHLRRHNLAPMRPPGSKGGPPPLRERFFTVPLRGEFSSPLLAPVFVGAISSPLRGESAVPLLSPPRLSGRHGSNNSTSTSAHDATKTGSIIPLSPLLPSPTSAPSSPSRKTTGQRTHPRPANSDWIRGGTASAPTPYQQVHVNLRHHDVAARHGPTHLYYFWHVCKTDRINPFLPQILSSS